MSEVWKNAYWVSLKETDGVWKSLEEFSSSLTSGIVFLESSEEFYTYKSKNVLL